nr:MAG TPA: hypothetical protein [Caudoviricetes sp.]
MNKKNKSFQVAPPKGRGRKDSPPPCIAAPP